MISPFATRPGVWCRRGRGIATMLTSFVLGFGWSVGCTPTLAFDQCTEDADCVNAAGLDLVCMANECVPRPSPSDVACEKTRDCVEAFDDDHVCGPAGVCASLASEECGIVQRPEDAAPEDVVYIGSILATSPPFDAAIVPIQNAVQLAVEDFDVRTRLIGDKRIGWVGCDSQGSPAVAVEAARHLVEDLGISAIVGPSFSESVLEVAEKVAVPGGAFVITPTATVKTITDLPDDGLVWRTIASDIYQASALGDLLPLLDPPAGRVLILSKDDAYGRTLSSDFQERLAQTLPNGKIAKLNYANPASFGSSDELRASYGQVIAQGFPHDADTVVLIGTSEVRDLVLFYLQVRDDENPPPPLPRFVVSHGAIPALLSVVELVDPSFRPQLMAAMHGTAPIIQDEENFAAFNIRYKIRFADQDALSPSSLGYDATMVSLLGMVGTGLLAPTGHQIADAMKKLVDANGTYVPFSGDLSFVSTARDVLAQGGTVDLQGVTGPLDFDLQTGEVRTNLIRWALVPKAGTNNVPVLTPVGVYVLGPPPAHTGTWMDL